MRKVPRKAATSLVSLLDLTLEDTGLSGVLPEYVEVLILSLQPALPSLLRQVPAGLVRPDGRGGEVEPGGLSQGDLHTLRPDVGRVLYSGLK